jgi:hypothetical protein
MSEASTSQAASRDGAVLLLLAGGITSALALTGVYFASVHGENIMGWYANYVIPAGALLVGLVASSGFGLSSWSTGTKITGKLLGLVILLLVASYFVAQYLGFRQLFASETIDGEPPIGFWSYFDLATRAFHWAAKSDRDAAGEPFGALGYAMRGLEIAGFALGGVLAPLALRKQPYCELCRRYKRTRRLGWIAAGVVQRRVARGQREAFGVECEVAFGEGHAKAERMVSASAAGDVEAVRHQLADDAVRSHRKVAKLTARIAIEVIHCRSCAVGDVRAVAHAGSGNQVQVTELRRAAMPPGAVAGLVGSATLPKARLRAS